VKPALRVLVVEDSALDAELVVRELRREYEVEFERVESAAAVREALRRPWDLLCADWQMPGFTAPDAFRLVKEAGLDVPFIIISGMVGEETAVAAMRTGVHDFIPKTSLSRLLPAVQRELREARGREERRKMEQQLAISDRLASVGMIAAGVAHEINNPLAALVTNLEAAQECIAALATLVEGAAGAVDGDGAAEPPAGERWRRVLPLVRRGRISLDDAVVAADRIQATARDLKVFSKADSEEKVLVDVREVLESTARLAATATRHCARTTRDFAEVPPVLASEGRLSQVFLNLILNAAQAIAEGRAAENEIRLVTRFDGARQRVVVEVRDTGSGIAEEHLPRLFDPFFTTKPAGIGTGLGLAICHRIVSALDGRIEVRTRVGQGSTFAVELPAAAPGAAPGRRRPRRRAAVTAPPPRRGRVLVVDDDPIVASAVARTLEREHDVVALQAAAEALRRIGAGERFDVILCDLMMPDMTGMDLHDRLREVAPDQAQRMVFLTGGVFTPHGRAFLERVPNVYVEKPFRSEQLRALVAEALSGAEAGPPPA
jgi:signal transduction histidine kinase